ncbi:ferredoxin [Actinomadura craniellae]|uniref:Ferredoxin n=1 Tax=Actinomadura craniellae TaxID=2231787 RepID=A0A365HD18_9ACTN|nr:ferredoxin--NADP reductase [Actinomadura craniellae]RAY16929.1 ferredoxin [Actinomadura craniellae]
MQRSDVARRPAGSPRDRGVHALRVVRAVRETADARSFVFEIPAELADKYIYQAGQFLTFRLELDGRTHLRSYSMSSSPAIDDQVRVTVKRVSGGVVSNWMNDTLQPGDEIEATVPAGAFVLGEVERDVVAFAGGSGITPVFSIVKTALATSSRRVRLLYANRDRDSVIFGAELAELAERYGDQLAVTHHHDADSGLVREGEIRPLLDSAGDAEFYLCGPEPFMELVERTLLAAGVGTDRIHIERFTPLDPAGPVEPSAEAAAPVRVTVRIGRDTVTGDHRHGSTILQTARFLGLRPPSSCESGSCATCMARVVEGAASMRNNEALTPEEVAEGWVLTCQAVPTGPSVHVVYE